MLLPSARDSGYHGSMFAAPASELAPLPQNLEAVIRNYDPEAQLTARGLFSLYGMPDEASATHMVWLDRGPFLSTVVDAKCTPTNFPVPHHACVEQSVAYPVGNALGKFDALGAFDGALSLKRTQGILTVRHDSPALNLIALNLAHEIITGRRNWQQARAYFGQAARAVRSGVAVPYAQGLVFRPIASEDADVSV